MRGFGAVKQSYLLIEHMVYQMKKLVWDSPPQVAEDNGFISKLPGMTVD